MSRLAALLSRRTKPNRRTLFLERLENRSLLTAGALDPTFGVNGKVTTDFGQYERVIPPTYAYESPAASDIALADGKTIVAGYAGGDFQITRFNADGTRDSSFGAGGTFSTSPGYLDGSFDYFGQPVAGPAEIAVQADGKIVATLFNGFDGFAVLRLNSDGSLDTTFDGDGQQTIQFTDENPSVHSDVPRAILVQPDGKIVVAGTLSYGGSNFYSSSSDFAIARLETDGSLDTSFDGNGKKVIDFPSGNDTFTDIVTSVGLQSDGKLVVGGFDPGDGGGAAYELARLNVDGSLDDTYGPFGSGIAYLPVSWGSRILVRDMIIQPDDKIVFAASSQTFAGSMVARFDNNGNLEAEVNLTVLSHASGLALQPDGGLVVAGVSPLSPDFAIVRMNADLTPYESGVGFLATTIEFDESAQATQVALQDDGKVIVAGRLQQSTSLAMARLDSAGVLDQSYGDGGILRNLIDPGGAVLEDFSSSGSAVTVQPDGKTIVAGTVYRPQNGTGSAFAIARYSSDGSLDSTFGDGGRVTIDFSSDDDVASAVALQNDGKIVVAGTSQGHMAVARLNTDGSLDFDAQRIIPDFFSFGDVHAATSLTIQSDGKIVLAGSASQSIGDLGVFAVARLNTDLFLDTDFGQSGTQTAFATLSSDSSASAVTIQPDGKIVLAGHFAGVMAVVRFASDGSIDTTFGVDGLETFNIGNPFFFNERAVGVATDSSGKLIVAGTYYDGVLSNSTNFVALRLNDDGSTDGSFGVGGIADIDLGSDEHASGMVIQTDGKIVISGVSQGDFAVARLTSEGLPDDTFTAGTDDRIDFGSEFDSASGVALDSDGNIVLVGSTQIGTNDFGEIYNFAVARLMGTSDIVITGTPGNDNILLFPQIFGPGFWVLKNGDLQGPLTATDRIVVHGLAGNDDIVTLLIGANVWLYGDAGHDRLKGSLGDDVLLGGEGDDLLVGSFGRDILIGGTGKDRIEGNSDDDILIAGFTSFTDEDAALLAIQTEWTSSHTYAQRTANLATYLRVSGPTATVHDDNEKDTLTGDSGRDWFFANLILDPNDDATKKDKITDLSSAEFAADLDFILGP